MKIGLLASNCSPVSVRSVECILAHGPFDGLAGIEKKVRLGLSGTMVNGIKLCGSAPWFPRLARVPRLERVNAMKLAEKA